MKAAFIRADSPARRTSAASASAKPPPQAAPCTQAMIGCGARRISITSSLMRRWPRSAGLHRAGVAAVAAGVLLQIEPGAEGAPGAAQDDDARVAIRRQAAEEVAQLGDHRRVERVECLGTVQRQPGDLAIAADIECGVGHAGGLLPSPPPFAEVLTEEGIKDR